MAEASETRGGAVLAPGVSGGSALKQIATCSDSVRHRRSVPLALLRLQNHSAERRSGGSQLPRGAHEALINVFRLLPVAERVAVVPFVCRDWRDAAFDSASWTHVEISEVRLREGYPDGQETENWAPDSALDISWEASAKQLEGLVKKAIQLSQGNLLSLQMVVPTSEALAFVASGCPHLQRLTLSRSYKYAKTEGIEAVAAACGSLTHIDLSGCLKISDQGVEALARGCPSLARLSLSGCHRLTDHAVYTLAASCPRLTSLDLAGCPRLSSDAIVGLARSCQGLTSLNVACCRWMDDSAVLALASHCPNLRRLDVGSCPLVTDVATVALAQSCPRLSHLSLRYCTLLTNATLLAVAAGCPLLSELDITGCTNFSDPAVIAVMQRCPGVSRLALRGCCRLTDAALQAVASRQPRILDVHGCGGMSQGAIAEVALQRESQNRWLVSSY